MSLVLNGDNGITFPNSSVQASAGSVLQVVQGSTSTQVSNSTNVFVDTTLTATITPKFATSKILVLVSQQGLYKSAANVANQIAIKLFRGATDLGQRVYAWGYMNNATVLTGSASFEYLDSPATTSATTYKTQFNEGNNTAAAIVQLDSVAISTITLLEIAA